MDEVKPLIRFIETHELLKSRPDIATLNTWPQVYENQLAGTIKVIEYSAYQALLEKLEIARVFIEKITTNLPHPSETELQSIILGNFINWQKLEAKSVLEAIK